MVHLYVAITVSFFLQNDEPPEITYCVVEHTGTLSLQALTPTQPMPPQDELDAKFAELVVSDYSLVITSVVNQFEIPAQLVFFLKRC